VAGEVGGAGCGAGASLAVGDGRGRGVVGAGGGTFRVGVGTALGTDRGRTTGFSPSIGPCTVGVLGELVGSGRLQFSADCAEATWAPASTPTRTIGSAAAACPAREV